MEKRASTKFWNFDNMHEKPQSVDIVIPVYNEENCLQKNVLILYAYLKEVADFSWDIIIADSGSTDKTSQIATYLSLKYENIRYINLPIRGRGYSLRKAFLQSNADILCYMDADLSINFHYLKLLIEGITCGFDISVASRLMQGSRVKRRLNRKIISRVYNFLIKSLFFNSFSDAQCGFKALRTDVAKRLVPLVKNNNWFFDTELLLLAEYNKYRIFEVPVKWTEDIKTRVPIGKTIWESLAGLLRMRFSIHKKAK